jgi:hypothetical protein
MVRIVVNIFLEYSFNILAQSNLMKNETILSIRYGIKILSVSEYYMDRIRN